MNPLLSTLPDLVFTVDATARWRSAIESSDGADKPLPRRARSGEDSAGRPRGLPWIGMVDTGGDEGERFPTGGGVDIAEKYKSKKRQGYEYRTCCLTRASPRCACSDVIETPALKPSYQIGSGGGLSPLLKRRSRLLFDCFFADAELAQSECRE